MGIYSDGYNRRATMLRDSRRNQWDPDYAPLPEWMESDELTPNEEALLEQMIEEGRAQR